MPRNADKSRNNTSLSLKLSLAVCFAASLVAFGAWKFQWKFPFGHVPTFVSFFYQPRMALAAARARNAPANFAGRRAIVIGGTSGIGHGIALRLAQANFDVTLVGRNAERGKEIVAELSAKGGKDHDFISCDATLMSNIKAFAPVFAAKHQNLDILVETQGIASMAGRTETTEGIDQKLALHYYGRIAFIQALLPMLRKSPHPRVLSVLSAGVHGVYSQYESDPYLKTQFSLKNAADAAGTLKSIVSKQFI